MRVALFSTALVLHVCIGIALAGSLHAGHRRARDAAAPERPAPSGDISVHDPSGITFDNSSSTFYLFGTGLLRGEILASHTSKDGYAWVPGAPPIQHAPAWVAQRVPLNRGGFWAPDLILLSGWWHLYYAVSTFGAQTSCIGVTTTRALDPASPDFGWVDRGAVICSSPSTPYNCIDPHAFVDPATGRVWLNYGSYWHGIYLVELTAAPFYNATTSAAPVNLALDADANRDIEASWVQRHPSLPSTFFLMANWGQCCEGVNSTYNIRIGRSTTGPSGPYIDRAGVDMAKGGGTLLITSAGRQVGPGQIGFPVGAMGAETQTPTVSYHYYDSASTPPGLHTLGEGTLDWGTGKDDWPVITDRM